jgi:hypothetical protein
VEPSIASSGTCLALYSTLSPTQVSCLSLVLMAHTSGPSVTQRSHHHVPGPHTANSALNSKSNRCGKLTVVALLLNLLAGGRLWCCRCGLHDGCGSLLGRVPPPAACQTVQPKQSLEYSE